MYHVSLHVRSVDAEQYAKEVGFTLAEYQTRFSDLFVDDDIPAGKCIWEFAPKPSEKRSGEEQP